jgi:large subunit ribosomal protein L17
MRHRIKGKKLGRKRGHRRELIKNLTTSLILYEKIITSETKGKIVKAKVDQILTLAKKNDLHCRRLILSKLNSKLAALKIFEDLNSQFKNRKSGFTRIIKTNNRLGDNAPMVLVELLIKHKEDKRKTEKVEDKKSKLTPAKKEKQKPGFWDRLRGQGTQVKEVRTTSKKTIERTTSK